MIQLKHFTYCIIGCAFGSTITACSLDENPRDQIPEEQAYTSQTTLFQNTIATLYNYIGGYEDGQGLQGTCRGVYDLNTFGSDEAMLPTRGVDWYDGGIWQQMYRHSWSAGHEIPKNAWIYLYKVITLCNRSLEQLELHKDLLDSERLSVCVAEARALRAIYYWYLMDLFGNVPIITSTSVSMNDVKQSDRAEVFNFVEKELTEACEYLHSTNGVRQGYYYGRVTKPVAYFVLAKLMLNAEVYTGVPRWEDCITYCDRIEEMGYKLEESYTDNFAIHNEDSEENIWVIPMNKTLFRNQQQNIFRSYHWCHAAAYGFAGENGTCATLRVLEISGYGTDEQDSRFDLNYWADDVVDFNGEPILDRTGQPLVYQPREVELDLSGSPFVETAGARMKKYAIDRTAVESGKLMENDIVLFRFADVLLMRAEAKLRSGLDGQSDYDAVRHRAGMPSRQITLQHLLDERLMELCWEGWRRQDLIRFGQYESLYDEPDKTYEKDGHTTIFPIPANALVLNHNLRQNPGY